MDPTQPQPLLPTARRDLARRTHGAIAPTHREERSPPAGRRSPWLALLVAVACRSSATQTPEPATTPTTTPDDPARAPSPCGDPGTMFDDHGWAPATAPAMASIRLDAPKLALALARLREHVRTPGHGLPIPLALSLAQWSWQIPLVVTTLRAAGFRPAELTFVADDAAAHAWIWRSTCDLDEAIERIETAWGVQTRRTIDAVIGTPTARAGDAPSFPYDVLMLPGERIALVPTGRGSSALARLARPAPTSGLAGRPRMSAGRRLDGLEPAEIRLVSMGLALVDPAVSTTPGDARSLRVTSSQVTMVTGPDDASVHPAR